MIKNKRFFLLIKIFSLFMILVFFSPKKIYAQEDESAESVHLTSEQQRVEMELKTSTLPELAVWARMLGLTEAGTREELSRRIREHFNMSEPGSPPENQMVITIESAQTTEYFRIEAVGEDYARLKGDVRLTMKDDGNIHTINAEEIIFNRTRNILTARGGVVYIKTTESDGTIETFRGENITVNIDTWASLFLDGSSERALTGEEVGYRFSGRVISRTGDDVTILRDASITNASQEEPFWSINASRIWLLPGSDFALFNAVLKVGEIPLFWFPVFYYPVDEMIFHPVIGVKSKEGAFVQTTTYLMGRPKSSSEENSITKILGGGGDMETERQGLFLMSTGRKYRDATETSLKLLVDHYVNLGTFAGLEFSHPRSSLLNNIDLSLAVGFTRTLTMAGGVWTPYAINSYNGESDWNHSNFLSISVPFRYRINFESGISGRYGSLNWRFPYYSDQAFHREFTEERSESMDWFNFMEQGPEIASTSTTTLPAPLWTLTGSLNPRLSFLNPYVTNISISTLSTSLTFRSLQDTETHINSPVRNFFVPNLYTIYNISASIGGTLLSQGRQGQSTGNSSAIIERENPLEEIGTPISPWGRETEKQQNQTDDNLLTIPILNQSFTLPRSGNLTFDIGYRIAPSSNTEMQFMSTSDTWKSPEDVDLNDIQFTSINVSGNTNIDFRLNHSTGLFSNTFTLSGQGSWRDFLYINEDAPAYQDSTGDPDPDKILAARQQLYGFTSYAGSYNYSGSLRPLLNDPIFGQSNISYQLAGTILNSRRYRASDTPYGPDLTPVWGRWEKQKIDIDNDIETYGLTRHSLSTSLNANLFNKTQTLTFGLTLPPLDTQINASATFRIWYSETSANFTIRQLAEDANPVKVRDEPEKFKYAGDWIFDQITLTENIIFPNRNSLNVRMIIKPEDNYKITNITSTLSLFNNNFRTVFSANETRRAGFYHEDNPDPNFNVPRNDPLRGRWEDYGNMELLPNRLTFTYTRSLSENSYFNNLIGISGSLNSSLNFDLIKYTNSNFTLGLSGGFKIRNIFDISISASTSNNVILRYFRNVPGMENITFMYKNDTELEKRQNNIFLDLIDSFNFFDISARERTGFKAGNFKIDIIHFLGDWEASISVNMKPYLNPADPLAGRDYPNWEVGTDFTFLVQWKPIPELKSDFTYEGQHDRWTIR